MQVSQAITRRSASNLALAFIMLPRAKRESMAALYAFCREVDDVADEDCRSPAERQATLAVWRADLQAACAGGVPQLAVIQELQPVIQRYRLPFALFNELLCGVEMDLEIRRYSTYAELDLYCYRVASVVGLLSIEVFGYQDPRCREYAILLGKALQLTNILRDIRVDAARDRIYVPQSELERFGVDADDILRGRYSERFQVLAGSVAERARGYYHQAKCHLPEGERLAMVAAELMGAVYWRLLRQLERRRFNVFLPRKVGLSRMHKLALILRAWCGVRFTGCLPAYGEK